MSDILQKFQGMNNNLQIAARDMSEHEYSRLFRELASIRSHALEARSLEHAKRISKLSADERISIAKRQLLLHYHIDSIVTATGLTRAEVEALRDAD